jgi:hypothetical protein
VALDIWQVLFNFTTQPSNLFILAALLVVILLHVQSSIQAIISTEHFSPCLSRLKSYCNATTTPIIGGDCTDVILDGLLDSNGNRPLFVNDATAIRYSLCESQCGASQLPFSWATFSQDFSAWLLPFLALISQLPFGAKHRLDNLTSVFLTVGSPTLAGYSLIMTVLNSRWITRKFEAIHYPNAELAVKILANLQYAPVRVLSQDHLLSSLIILPENDEWWNELSQLIDYKHTWSISAATSIAWVIIAYAFTVVDSIGNLSNVGSNGQSVGTVWLWLICIVTGWLQLCPKSDYSQLTRIFNRANNMAYVASPNGPIKASSLNQLRAISMDALLSGTLFFSDENRSPPIFNYARVLPWSSSAEIVAAAFHEASMDARMHRPVDGKSNWKDTVKSSDVHDENRRGSPEETDKYCDIGRPQSRWASGVFARMVVASTIALTLQFGTAGASFIGEYFSPTIVCFPFIVT